MQGQHRGPKTPSGRLEAAAGAGALLIEQRSNHLALVGQTKPRYYKLKGLKVNLGIMSVNKVTKISQYTNDSHLLFVSAGHSADNIYLKGFQNT